MYEYMPKKEQPMPTNRKDAPKHLKAKTNIFNYTGKYAGLQYYNDVVQRIKFNIKKDTQSPSGPGPQSSNEIKYGLTETDIQNIIEAIKNNSKLRGKLGFFRDLDVDEAANKCIDIVGESLRTDPTVFDSYVKAANMIVNTAIKIIHTEETDKAKKIYKINNVEQEIKEEDIDAVKSDKMLDEIRKNQGKGAITDNEFNMLELQYHDFYSRSAMRDEVTRKIIECGPKHKTENKGGRSKSPYTINYSESDKWLYDQTTQHHIVPLSTLKPNNPNSSPSPSDRQQTEWKLDNLVLGPDRNRRIYEPGAFKDSEAEYVKDKSKAKIKVVREEKSHSEHMAAAMRTDDLLNFYTLCETYVNDTENEKLPQNLIETAHSILKSFPSTRACHSDENLFNALQIFIDNYKSKEDFINKKPIVELIQALNDYGRGEFMYSESADAAMRTDYLQYFYTLCKNYVNATENEERPQNLLETACIIHARFSYIEKRHCDEQLLKEIDTFKQSYPKKENFEYRRPIVNQMITALIEYGKREDALLLAGGQSAVP